MDKINPQSGTAGLWISLILGLILVVGFQPNSAKAQSTDANSLTVLTKKIEPFVSYQNDKFSGFSIELWQLIAEHQNLKYRFKLEPTLASLLSEMKEGSAEVAIAAVTITADREKDIDFSHPFFRSGLAILTTNNTGNIISQIGSVVRSMFLSESFAIAGLILLIILLVVSHIIWLLERRSNPQFSKSYLPGLWDSLWWALVTLATVGYGDKAPKAVFGRLFAMFWMVVGYFMFAYFTASVTSTVTIRELRGTIKGPQDLPGHKVAVIAKSTSDKYMGKFAGNVRVVRVDNIERAYDMLSNGRVEAIVHDSPVLFYHVQKNGNGKIKIAGSTFQEEDYGIVFPDGSKLREPVNQAILELVENGKYAKLYTKWFGQSDCNMIKISIE